MSFIFLLFCSKTQDNNIVESMEKYTGLSIHGLLPNNSKDVFGVLRNDTQYMLHGLAGGMRRSSKGFEPSQLINTKAFIS